MKSITIVFTIVILFSCSGFGANPGEASASEKGIQELIKQLDSRTWDQAAEELVRIGEPAVEPLLRALGVRKNSTVVVYGDGGPEPYRLWWTLRLMAGFDTRVLDGGLHAWKAAGHHVAGGDGLEVTAGDVSVRESSSVPIQRWPAVSSFMDHGAFRFPRI